MWLSTAAISDHQHNKPWRMEHWEAPNQSRASNFEKQKKYVLLEKKLNYFPKTDIPGQQSFKGFLREIAAKQQNSGFLG